MLTSFARVVSRRRFPSRPRSADETAQHELIYTVANDSDARTQWRGSDGVVYSAAPPPNSLLLFRSGGAWHRVVGREGLVPRPFISILTDSRLKGASRR